jgi:hypothetical protein
MSRRRRLLAALAALGVFALQPAAAGRAALNADANLTCPIAVGMPAVTGQVLPYTGTLSCYRPGGHKQFGGPANPPDTTVRDATPTQGEQCSNVFNHPVTFTEDNSGAVVAHATFAGGATSGDFPLSAEDAAKVGTQDAFLTDVQRGSYEPPVPPDPNNANALTCQINPTFHFFCLATATIDPPQVCLKFVPAFPITMQTSLPQDWGPFFQAAIGTIGGGPGNIVSAPSQNGVVNSPVCFWIPNMGIPAERRLVLTLAGAPDAFGRQIFYTLLATVQFAGVTWHFGDGSDKPSEPIPSGCQGLIPQGLPPSAMAAHSYQQISDGLPGGVYQVSATEQLNITVQMFWVDSNGSWGPVTVPSGVTDPSLDTPTYPQYVGQVEGVPIGGP